MPYALLSWMLLVSAPTYRSVDIITLEHSHHIYPIRVADEGAVAVYTPFPCRSLDFKTTPSLQIEGAKSTEGNYFVVVGRRAKVGTIVQGNAHCDGFNLAIELTVVPAASASPRAEFVFHDDDKRVVDRFNESVLAGKTAQCQQEVQYWRDGPARQLNWVLEKRSERRDDVVVKRHGRGDGFLILHVDGLSHIGDQAIVDFRVQNRESKQLVIQSLSVAGQGPSKLTSEFLFNEDGVNRPAKATDAVWLPMTILAPGATARGSVTFQRGVHDHRITLRVVALGEDQQTAEVTNIEL